MGEEVRLQEQQGQGGPNRSFENIWGNDDEVQADGPPGLLNGDDEVDSESEADDDAEQGEVQVGARLNNAQLPPPLPSLHEVHVTRIFTHKWPPKSARAELTRAQVDLWSKVVENPVFGSN